MNFEKLIKELRFDIQRDSEKSLKDLETRIINNINEHIDEKFKNINNELENIKKKELGLETRITELEKYIRKNNLIFFAVDEGEKSYSELEKKVLSIITDDMRTPCSKIDIRMIRRLGKKMETKIRPIAVTFTTFSKKIEILRNKSYLKEKNIYIKEDYPKHILETRVNLQDQLQKERKNGKIAYIRYDKLIIREPTISNFKGQEKPPNIRKQKKRQLETSPLQEVGNLTSSEIQSEPITRSNTMKKTKLRKNTPKGGQSSVKHYFQKQNFTPNYTSTHSSDSEDYDGKSTPTKDIQCNVLSIT